MGEHKKDGRAVFGEAVRNGDTLFYCVESQEYNEFMKAQMFEVIVRERMKLITQEYGMAIRNCNDEGKIKTVCAQLDDALTIVY